MMKMYLKVYEVQDLISGTSDNGNDWEKQQVVFVDDMNKYYAVDFMGERKTRVTKTLKKGDLCEVTFEPQSRQWEDKWFTNLNGISVTVLQKKMGFTSDEPSKGEEVRMPEEESAF